ncbi:hypothetical protein ACFV99_23785 [Streptomyces sp. NPDC059944]
MPGHYQGIDDGQSLFFNRGPATGAGIPTLGTIVDADAYTL